MKTMNVLKKYVAPAGLLVSGAAMATPPATIADLTAGISFSDVGLGVLAVVAALITLSVTIKGAVTVWGMISGRHRG